VSDGADNAEEPIGYGRPPTSSRFAKGQSGNPRGRPRNRRNDIPYDHVLGQMVTIRDDRGERRVTAAEAFLLQLTKKGLQGDSASARACLAAIEEARSKRQLGAQYVSRIICKGVSPGSVGCSLNALGMAVKLRKYSDAATYQLKSWLVELAVARLGERRLSVTEQKIVLDATATPEKVQWPDWWRVTG
jgi:hypothetical protein